MIRHIFKKSLLIATCTLGTQMVHADHLVECPNVATLGTSSYGVALPYAYDKQEKSVRFVSLMFEPAQENERSRFSLVVYPVPVAFSEEPERKTRELINQLVLETSNPVNYRIANETTVPMCVYSLPNDKNVNAFLFADDGEDTNGNDFSLKSSSKKMNQLEQVMKFMKFFN